MSIAYDNIRLLRRKVEIAQRELETLEQGPRRDESLIHLAQMTDDLVRAVRDFADMGYEEQVAAYILDNSVGRKRSVGEMH